MPAPAAQSRASGPPPSGIRGPARGRWGPAPSWAAEAQAPAKARARAAPPKERRRAPRGPRGAPGRESGLDASSPWRSALSRLLRAGAHAELSVAVEHHRDHRTRRREVAGERPRVALELRHQVLIELE